MTLIITSGEPAGIGPDILLKAACKKALPGIVLGDVALFKQRARLLNLDVSIQAYHESAPFKPEKNQLYVKHLPLRESVQPGYPNKANAEYILAQLDMAVSGCLSQHYSGMVTAPVCKSIICDAGYLFSGHTEYIAHLTKTKHVVMMLACQKMRVALVTTHLPLSKVPSNITPLAVEQTLLIVKAALQKSFGIDSPKIMVAGLNPHAGENGYLGREEIEVIQPVISAFNSKSIIGPVAADTMFSQRNCQEMDAFIAMYHDQGLSVLKYAGFGCSANISLGLPIIRTSVDHGTAFSLAGTGSADEGSLIYAVEQAELMSVRERLLME